MSFVDFSAHAVNPLAGGAASAARAAAQAAASSGGDDTPSFGDLLDIVNPLQHFPIVSTLYRAVTGDTIKTLPKIAGDALFGGLPGLASSVADSIFTKITGKSVGDTVLAFVEDAFSSGGSAVASNTPALTAAANIPSEAIPALPVPSLPVADATLADATVADAPVVGAPLAGATMAANSSAPSAVTIPNLPVPSLPATTVAAAAPQDAILVPGQESLLLALNRSGVDQDVALRAADAYRRTVAGMPAAAN